MYLFIINSRSGGGAGRRTWRTIQALLAARAVPYEALFTQSADSAEDQVLQTLARREDWRAAIIVGGDGTIHSVLGALRRRGSRWESSRRVRAMTLRAGSASRSRPRQRWTPRCRNTASKPICSARQAGSP